MNLVSKRLTKIVISIIVVLLALFSGSVQAATQNYGLQEYRKARSDGAQYGYKVSDKLVWKIVTYNGSTPNYDKTLYCLKAEQGFYTATPGTFQQTYDLTYDFMNSNNKNNVSVPSQYYNSIVWILKHAYIQNASTASSDKTTLLTNAGIRGNGELTDDDIDVVQQLAIWYFTNYDNSTYHKDFGGQASFQTVLESKYSGGVKGDYTAIEDKNQTRYDNMEKLFVYLVENAKKVTESGNSDKAPLSMANTTPTVTQNGNNYVVGPYKINKDSELPYSVSITVTNQNGQNLNGKYTVLDSNKNSTNQSLEQLVGQTFYLSIPVNTVNSEGITTLRVSMSGNYTSTSATYWTKAGNNTVQPIVEINRTPSTFNGSKEATFPKGGKYNLKLIKVDSTNQNTALGGAKFKIVTPKGTETLTTNSNGIIEISDIPVTTAGQDTITIEETEAPAGYAKIITSPINVVVTKSLSNNVLGMTNAVISNQQTGSNLSMEGNVIVVKVQNKPKKFDLALRKYITKVNGTNVANSRVPNIDTSTLNSGTTATYKHRKDPIVIKTGDKVIYNLTIYNEGEKAGRATKLEDQLPTGLKYSKVVSGNFELNSYNESDNLLKLKRTSNADNLSAYAGGNLSSETVQIECEVTATADKTEKILTNVAWISEEYDAESNKTITNTPGEDRDSEPYTKPNVNKDNMSNYTGNNNKKDLTDSNNYYKGQQDDDDFEKLILKPKKDFDLALRKYITKVNGADVANSRIPNIDTSTLNNGTTATYKHRKDPVEVKTGDKVIYNLTIYNEGEKAGRATKIEDQLPTGLKYSKVVSGNFELDSYNESDNLLKLKRTSNTDNLPAYSQGNLKSETVQVECEVVATAEATNKILTNVAWISEEYDAEENKTITNTPGEDRDSEPYTKPNVNKDNMSDYTGNNNKTDLTDSNNYYKGQQDDDDFEKLILKPSNGNYELELIKVDSRNNNPLNGAKFKIIAPNGETTQTTANGGKINISSLPVTTAGEDTITIEEIEAPAGYSKIITTPIKVKITKALVNGKYTITKAEIENQQNGASVELNGTKITVTVQNYGKNFDLALRKYITQVNGKKVENSRVPNIDTSTLKSGTTATYKHRKDPVEIKTGDKVIYNLTIYNEGEKAGRATKIEDQLPTGLKYTKVISGNFELDSYSETDNLLKLKRTSNTDNLAPYTNGNLQSETVQIECEVTATADKTDKILTNVAWISEEYDAETNKTITNTPGEDRDSEPSTKPNVNKDNMSDYTGNNNKKDLTDKDNYYKGQQDDDDFEKLVLKRKKDFDLALRKYITQVNGKDVENSRVPNVDTSTLKNGTTASYKHRKDPVVVKTGDEIIYNLTIYNEGEKPGRATKIQDQLPTGIKFLKVVSGNFELDSYNEEDNLLKLKRTSNTDNLPAYSDGKLSSETVQIACTVTAKAGKDDKTLTNVAWISEEFDAEENKTITDKPGEDRDSEPSTKPDVNKDNMEDYTGKDNKKDLTDKDNYYKGQQDDDDFEKLTMKAAKGEYKLEIIKVDSDNKKALQGAEFKITFQDGTTETMTTDENGKISIPSRKITEEGTEIIKIEETKAPEHYKKVIDSLELKITKELSGQTYNVTKVEPVSGNMPEGVSTSLNNNTISVTVNNKKKVFDLALRKFITAVNDTEVTNRIPSLSIGDNGKIKYDHTKDPVDVENGNIVTYTLRIFNEGEIDGYASKIKDDVPQGLEFLPDNEINKQYRWVASQDGKTIVTDYLSKEQEKTEGANLIKAFDSSKGITNNNPDYRDVKIAFKVVEPNTSDRILVNTAEIADDRDEHNNPIDDIDSTPDNNNEWNKEDDLDKEFVKVKYFDLALKKWVTKAIVTNQNGTKTVTETGHTGDENPEPPAKVDLGRQDINKVTVKFEFNIKVTNEGEIAGYAKEITDYIPEGLKFIQADNPNWYTREPLNGRERVATKQLENTLLQPGESATVSIVLTWKNGQNNMGLKTNIAEISQDYNDSHTPDIDSTPDNFKEGEDDIDNAPVMLTVKLGDAKLYIGLTTTIVLILAGGIWAIRRYVLD